MASEIGAAWKRAALFICQTGLLAQVNLRDGWASAGFNQRGAPSPRPFRLRRLIVRFTGRGGIFGHLIHQHISGGNRSHIAHLHLNRAA